MVRAEIYNGPLVDIAKDYAQLERDLKVARIDCLGDFSGALWKWKLTYHQIDNYGDTEFRVGMLGSEAIIELCILAYLWMHLNKYRLQYLQTIDIVRDLK